MLIGDLVVSSQKHLMDHVRGVDRNQTTMISLSELVAEDSVARVIDMFVEALPVIDLGFARAKTAREGRPPYSPMNY